MFSLQVIAALAGTLLLVSIGGSLVYVLRGRGAKQSNVRALMGSDFPLQAGKQSPGRLKRDAFELDAETFRKQSRRKGKAEQDEVVQKLFKAGFYTAKDRRRFLQFRIVSFIAGTILLPLVLIHVSGKPSHGVFGILLGAIIGFSFPMSWLERQIRRREEEILFYLPLVVEQVAIGVSSALDIGPCIINIVNMADERDSHNPVTELFVHVQKLMRSGLSLEQALTEVGETNGTTEIKHAFMLLSQCARHGGEVSKQLQELADSMMMQRQIHIEGKITALPVKATGPLAMVFAGFFALLFSGILVHLLEAFGVNYPGT